VAIYGRVSTEHEAQISALENQIQYYDNVLKAHPNWILQDRYIDKGITGTSMLKRDSFMRMMQDAKAGKFDLIITREVSRFARNTADTLVQVRFLVNNDIAVYFTEDNIFASLFSEDEWELKLSIMATLAQNESKKISTRVKAGQKISFENGVFYGNGSILGYDRVGKDMVINKEQAETVRRIYDLYLEGNGLRKIQFILEQEGRKTALGKSKWNSEVISRVLKNEFYYGMIEYRKEFIPDYLTQKKIKNKGEVEKVRVKGTHEPIVTEEEYNRVQEIFQTKVRKQNGKNVGHGIPKDVYCRKLICECGHTFNKRRGYVTKNNEQRYLYQCYKQLHDGTVRTRKNKGLDTSDCCTSITVPNWKLEITADWIFRKFFDNKQLIYERTVEMLEEALNVSSSVQDVNIEINECKEKIAALHEKYSVLVDLYTEGNIPKDIYLEKGKRVEESIEARKMELATLENKLKKVQDENNVLERKRAIADFLSVKAFKARRAIPQELIEYYVDSIKVDSEKMTWILKVPQGTSFDNNLKITDSSKKKLTL
jgi:DNA invertase Pin-like site-specific DNA recombinase